MTQHSTTALIAEPLPHERAAGRTPLSLGGELRWPTWNAAVALLVAVLIVRLAYLIWLSPFELVGDEAYYWEQSRHLDLCYNEKGPALPWMIAGCSSLSACLSGS